MAARLKMSNTKPVDMSAEAIDQRLRDLGQLYKLGVSLRSARRLGRVRDLTSSVDTEPAESPTQREDSESTE
jgi:hypothetical protein